MPNRAITTTKRATVAIPAERLSESSGALNDIISRKIVFSMSANNTKINMLLVSGTSFAYKNKSCTNIMQHHA